MVVGGAAVFRLSGWELSTLVNVVAAACIGSYWFVFVDWSG